MIKDMDYLVYKIYCKISKKSYIGLTSRTLSQRWYFHLKTKDGFALHNAIHKYGNDAFIKRILKSNLTKKEAQYWEKKLIKTNHTLFPLGYNLTKGGEGVGGCIATNNKISKSIKLYFENPDNRNKQRKIALNQWKDKEFINKMSIGLKIRWTGSSRMNYLKGLQSKENKEKHRKKALNQWKDPKYREKQKQSTKRRWYEYRKLHVLGAAKGSK
jgi:group I intron endonuclease